MTQDTPTKVIGVGLNKTGTKTLAHYLRGWGSRHQTFDLAYFRMYREGRIEQLLDSMQEWDSFEDWPWPLLFREIDERFPDAKFVLTVRKSPEIWYRSLCNMAVRMGPLDEFERHIYGYSMPQGRRREHLEFYEAHNRAVEDHFRDRPRKLVRICWGEPEAPKQLANFLGHDLTPAPPAHENRSSRRVYSGDILWLAHANRIAYRPYWYARRAIGRMTDLLTGKESSR